MKQNIKLIINVNWNDFIIYIATAINTATIVELIIAIDTVIIITTCMLAVINMPVVASIFNSFLAEFASFTRNGLINLDENYLHGSLNFLLLFFPFINNKLNAEPIFFCAFLSFFCGYQSITYFYIL